MTKFKFDTGQEILIIPSEVVVKSVNESSDLLKDENVCDGNKKNSVV
jgi:hypothetical protein